MTRGVSTRYFLSVLVCSVILLGCGRKQDDEAAEALVLLPKVQKDLDRARSNLNSLSEQLRMMQFERNQLSQQIRQLTSAREDAVNTDETMDENIDEMAAQMNQQTERISYLEEEIDRLNAIIEEQGATISQQQGTIAELVSLFEQRPIPEEQEEIIDR